MSNEAATRRRELRGELGVTQAQLARFLGVSGGTVSRWERDEGSVDFEPNGLSALFLAVLVDAVTCDRSGARDGVVHHDHRAGLRRVLDLADRGSR